MTVRQLTLLDPEPWRLSDKTKESARRGIAEARAALHSGSTERKEAAS